MNRSIVVLGLIAGCVTETGNPEMEGGGTFGVTGRTTAPDEVSLHGTSRAAAIEIESAWVVTGDIEFVAAGACAAGDDPEATIAGPRAVDLVGEPELVELRLEATEYCHVTIPIEPIEAALPDAAPDMLRGRSILLTGTRPDGVPFTIASTVDVALTIGSAASPFEVGTSEPDLLLGIDLATWLKGVPLDRARPDDSGHIWIDEERNGDILDAFEDRIEASFELFEDDGDHEIDDDDALLAAG